MNRRVELTWRAVLITLVFCGAVCSRTPLHAEEGSTIHIKAKTVHLGNGDTIDNAAVLLVDGKIKAVGKSLPVPDGAISMTAHAITPGLIDANAALESADIITDGPRSAREVLHEIFCPTHSDQPVVGCCGSTCPQSMSHVSGKSCPQCGFPNKNPNLAVGTRVFNSMAEHSSEIVPHTRVIDSVNLRSADMGRLLRGGVTTVFVSPDSAAVIGSQGAVVHTGGKLRERVIRDADAVKAAMGGDPSRRGRRNNLPFREAVNFHSRRPTTRMGVTWVFRKALHDTRRWESGLKVYGADAPTPAAMKVLKRVLDQEIPLRIMARTQRDILAAIRLTEEFQIPFVLEEATEAYRCVDELKQDGTPVIFGPIFDEPTGYRRFSFEANQSRFHTIKALIDAGIETALTAHELRDEEGLARQAMFAIRYGLDPDDALRSVTSTPAKILGLQDSLGTLEAGKQADVVLWSGDPFAATSVPETVIIRGDVVYDRS